MLRHAMPWLVLPIILAVLVVSFTGCARKQPAPPVADTGPVAIEPTPEGVPPLEAVERLEGAEDRPQRGGVPREPDLGDPTVPAIRWGADLEKAQARAKSEGKPVLVYFHRDTVPPAREMESMVWPDLPVRKLAREFVAVKIDAEKDEATTTKYNVVFIPSILFLKPDGSEFARVNHMLMPDEMADELESVLEKFKAGG